MDRVVAASYDSLAHDPRNHVPAPAALCIACGYHNDLVLRGEVFLCREQWVCQQRVRARQEAVKSAEILRQRRSA
jgi:hypothetical protein